MKNDICFNKYGSHPKKQCPIQCRILFFLCFIIVGSVVGLQLRDNTTLAQNNSRARSGSNPASASRNGNLIENQPRIQTLIREGTVMRSQNVMFRSSGNRTLMIMINGQERILCLENLNLERITTVIQNNPTLTDWEVDFIVTEYRGSNYALIQRAVLTSREGIRQDAQQQ